MPLPAQPHQPETIDISRDNRPWIEVCPDPYLNLEYVGTQTLNLHIIGVTQQKIGDHFKAVLHFSNNPRGLVLNKTNRDILVKLCGNTPADVIGKWIVVGLGFAKGNAMLEIKGFGSPTGPALAAPPPQQSPAPPANPNPVMSPELQAQFAKFLAATQAGASAT